MNENGSKSNKINGIVEIEISQLSKMKQMNENELKKWMNHSKSLKMIQNLPKWGKIVQSLPK